MVKSITIQNYKSFNDEICIEFGVDRVISLIGPNASGKSTVFNVLYNIKSILDNTINISEIYHPNIFNQIDSQSCKLGVVFTEGDDIYEYHVEYNSKEILEEILTYNDNIVLRRNELEVSLYTTAYTIEKKSTGTSALYMFKILLSVGESKKDAKPNEALDIFLSVYNILDNIYIKLDHFSDEIIEDETNIAIHGNLNDMRISDLTQKADPTLLSVITKLELKNSLDKHTGLESKESEVQNLINEMNKIVQEDKPTYECMGIHAVGEHPVRTLEYKYESEGTKKLFRLSPKIFEILENGGVLFIDELDSNLHPSLIVHAIIPLFINQKTNHNNAQLVFSMHNLGLLLYEEFVKNVKILGISQFPIGSREIINLDMTESENITKLINNFYGVTPYINDHGWE